MLTIQEDGFSEKDESLLKEIDSSLQVYRTKVWEPFDIYRKFIGKKKGEKLIASETISKNNTSLAHKISVGIRMNLFIPDARVGWYPYAKREIKTIIREHDISAIVSIGPPHSSHLAGWRVGKEHNIPFYPVFIDPWVDIVYYRGMKRSKLTVKADSYFEREVLRSASTAIFVTDSMREEYIKKYPFIKSKSEIIYWGYNEENFAGKQPVKSNRDKITILHAGNIFDYQNPRYLWIYIKEQLDSGVNIELRFAGSVSPGIKKALDEAGLSRITMYIGFLPYHKVVDEMLSADYLLVCATEKRHVPGKLFEYMRCAKPVIAFGEDNEEVEKLLRNSGAGKLYSYTDKDADFLKESISGQYVESEVKKYDRRNAAKTVSELLAGLRGENYKTG